VVAEIVHRVVRGVVRGSRRAPRVHLRSLGIIIIIIVVERRRRRGSRSRPRMKRFAREPPPSPRRAQRRVGLFEPCGIRTVVDIQRGKHVIPTDTPSHRRGSARAVEPRGGCAAARAGPERWIGFVAKFQRRRVIRALTEFGRGNQLCTPPAMRDRVRYAPHVPVHVPPSVPARAQALEVSVNVKVFHRRVSRDHRASVVHVAPRAIATQPVPELFAVQ